MVLCECMLWWYVSACFGGGVSACYGGVLYAVVVCECMLWWCMSACCGVV